MKIEGSVQNIISFFRSAFILRIQNNTSGLKAIYNLTLIIIGLDILGIVSAIVVPSGHFITNMVFDMFFIYLNYKLKNRVFSYFYLLIYFGVAALNVPLLLNGNPFGIIGSIFMIWVGFRFIQAVKAIKK